MILSTILKPPGAPPEKEDRGAVQPDARVLPATRERARRYNRILSIGLVLSVLFHILVVRLSPLIFRYLEPDVGFYRVPSPIMVPAEGMRVVEVEITESPSEPAREPDPRPEELPLEQPSVVFERVGAAERLRPRVGDWRLWMRPPYTRLDPTDEERLADVMARLYAAIEARDDSLAAELLREAEALDWTIGEGDSKWGISPGKIHLGGLTLPLPFYFAPHPATDRLSEDRNADWNAIQRQAGQGVIDDAFADRVRAIRERREREEAERAAQKDTTGTG